MVKVKRGHAHKLWPDYMHVFCLWWKEVQNLDLTKLNNLSPFSTKKKTKTKTCNVKKDRWMALKLFQRPLTEIGYHQFT